MSGAMVGGARPKAYPAVRPWESKRSIPFSIANASPEIEPATCWLPASWIYGATIGRGPKMRSTDSKRFHGREPGLPGQAAGTQDPRSCLSSRFKARVSFSGFGYL